jgi:hypothetical protein
MHLVPEIQIAPGKTFTFYLIPEQIAEWLEDYGEDQTYTDSRAGRVSARRLQSTHLQRCGCSLP